MKRTTTYAAGLLLALATAGAVTLALPRRHVPQDGPTRILVRFEGWVPLGCGTRDPIYTTQPVRVVVTGTSTVYNREMLPVCGWVDAGGTLTVTSVLTPVLQVEPGEPITYSLKGTFSHLSVSGQGVGGQEIAAPPMLAGDLDGDNAVGIGDFSMLKSVFGMRREDAEDWSWFERWLRSDIDGDGVVGVSDFGLLTGNFGRLGE